MTTKLEKVLYTAHAHTTGGRDGQSKTDDGRLSVTLSSPGTAGTGTNPEQLFAAGYAACFENAVRVAARRNKTPAGQASVTAKVGIGPNDSGGFQLAVELHVRLPDLDRELAEKIAAAAHHVCPYSNAVRGNVDVQVIVDPAPEVI